MVKFFRLAQVESVQFFQFDQEGNMYVFAPGAGCSGDAKLVRPGDEMIFNGKIEETLDGNSDGFDASCVKSETGHVYSGSSRVRSFNEPLKQEDLKDLGHKNFSPETMKKVNWVFNMFRDWRNYRNNSNELENVECDLDEVRRITKENLIHAVVRFLTEVKKIDGSDFPGKTLYKILICIQFHLETLGFNWKLINEDVFNEIKCTLDNLMKLCTSQGIGVSVKKAQVLMPFDEEFLWSLGLLGTFNQEVLLNTIVFTIGKGCALRASKEHYALRAPPFNSQFSFLRDKEGQIFVRYKEEIGFKTNKGGLKHRKVEPKEVDIYPIENIKHCPVRILMKYLSVLPPNRNCSSMYLQPKKKYTPDIWFQDRPAGVNKLRDVVKDICKKAGLPGFYSNHSLRGTTAMRMYRCNIDEQLIQEVTGYRSLCVRAYKKTSTSQHRNASNCLFQK